MKLQVYRAVIHWWMIVHFEYFDEWFSKSAFSSTNLKSEFADMPAGPVAILNAKEHELTRKGAKRFFRICFCLWLTGKDIRSG